MEDDRGTARKKGWVILLLMTGYTLSYVDRQIISLLVEPIKAELHLNDTQIGLMQGFAFAICYAVMGLPLARAIDRGHRPRIAAGCVAIWSAATAAGGFATHYLSFLLTRAATATAEAGLPPAALSLFSDLFSPRWLVRANAALLISPFLGTGLALLAGGHLLTGYEAAGGLRLPLIGLLSPWRAVLVTVALPGIILAPLLLTIQETPTRAARRREAHGTSGLAVAFREHGPVFVPYIFGTMFAAVVIFAQVAWLPTMLVRTQHLSPGVVGQQVGPIYLGFGLLGALIGSLILSQAPAEKTVSRSVTMLTATALVLVPASLSIGWAHDPQLVLGLFAVSVFASSIVLTISATPLQLLSPSHLRARVIAFAAMVVVIGGAGGGPFLVGLASDRVFGAISPAVAIIPACSALAGAACFAVASRRIAARRRASLA